MLTWQEKKARLRRVMALKAEVSALTDEVEELRALATTISAIRADGEGKAKSGGGNSRIENVVEQLDEITRRLLLTTARYARVYTEAESAIAAVPDDRYRTILRLKYINGLSWESVAERVGLTARRVRQLHRIAVEKIEFPG